MNVAPAARRGRPRSEASERAILDAALELMAAGSRPVTITEIARRAGVGKDTVYRRWRSKDDLLLDALATLPGSARRARRRADPRGADRPPDRADRAHARRSQPAHLPFRARRQLEPSRALLRRADRAAARGDLRRDRGGGAARRAARRHRRRPAGPLLFSPVLAETLEGRSRPALRGAPRAVATRLVDAALRGARPQLSRLESPREPDRSRVRARRAPRPART